MADEHRSTTVSPLSRIKKRWAGTLQIAFPLQTGSDPILVGDLVLLNSAGEVYRKDDNTPALGYVIVAPDATKNNNEATIVVTGYAVVNALAGAAVATGAKVNSQTYVDGSPSQFITTTTGGYADGVALNSAAALDDPLEVMLYRTPVYIP